MRSQHWYAGDDRDAFIHRAWMRRGLPDHAFDGRPQIVICNTWSDLTPCNGHFREIAEHVKRGVWEAGGVPLELPVPSLGETLLRPTAMFFRDLAAMVVEELIRANPVDGVVLLGGCDKTVPSLLMGAASVDLPTLMVTGGPMLNGRFDGRLLGCGTGVWEMSEDVRAGRMARADLRRAESAMIRSRGHCNTMGTASTMACVAEALGMTLPGNAGLPAADSRLLELAHAAGQPDRRDGRRGPAPERDPHRRGGAQRGARRRRGRRLDQRGGAPARDRPPGRRTRHARRHRRGGPGIPLLADIQPAGAYLMEDFHRAGGLDAVLGRSATTWSRAGPSRAAAHRTGLRPAAHDLQVIRTADAPISPEAGLAVLRGNLAPDGAVIKPAAATPALMRHRAAPWCSTASRTCTPAWTTPTSTSTADDVLVLRGCGPRGYPGMPEVGNMPLPRKLLENGVRDMVRISDARMSGTAYGTVVLHVAPESAAGGPLGLVRTGDPIALDVAARTLHLDVPDAELARREPVTRGRPARRPAAGSSSTASTSSRPTSGAGLDFLAGVRGSAVARESH